MLREVGGPIRTFGTEEEAGLGRSRCANRATNPGEVRGEELEDEDEVERGGREGERILELVLPPLGSERMEVDTPTTPSPTRALPPPAGLAARVVPPANPIRGDVVPTVGLPLANGL
jgi:hypothetical protein